MKKYCLLLSLLLVTHESPAQTYVKLYDLGVGIGVTDSEINNSAIYSAGIQSTVGRMVPDININVRLDYFRYERTYLYPITNSYIERGWSEYNKFTLSWLFLHYIKTPIPLRIYVGPGFGLEVTLTSNEREDNYSGQMTKSAYHGESYCAIFQGALGMDYHLARKLRAALDLRYTTGTSGVGYLILGFGLVYEIRETEP